MIRTNLSTRPFYNETAVRVWLLLVAFLVAAATFFNIQRLVHYSRSDTELATQASRDEHRAVELRADATRLRASVNTAQVEAASVDAKRANDLIDRRTFSWTELFNRLEATLPPDIRITSLRQNTSRERGTVLKVTLLARNVDDVNEFMENLEASSTGAFSDLLAQEERMNPDTGLLEVTLEAQYHPPASTPMPTPAADVPAATAGKAAK